MDGAMSNFELLQALVILLGVVIAVIYGLVTMVREFRR
jgi:hypothetical protein